MQRKSIYLIIAMALLLIAASILIYLPKFAHNPASKQGAHNQSMALGVDGSIMNASQIRELESFGVHWIRLDISENKSFERYAANLTSQNISILGIIDYRTLGVKFKSVAGGLECMSNCNWTLSDWLSNVSKVVNMYPQIHVWEIWNEPQLPIFQDGFNNGSAYNYFLMLKGAYGIIKQSNSSDTVLCLGGDNIYEGGTGPWLPGYYWAEALWRYNASRYCSAISLHAYTGFRYLINQSPAGNWVTMGDIFNGSLSAYENLTNKPIWITEIGIPSNNGIGLGNMLDNSYNKQALFLNQTFSLFTSKPYMAGIFWFNANGYVDSPYNFSFGLFNRSFSPKPSAYAFKSFSDEEALLQNSKKA